MIVVFYLQCFTDNNRLLSFIFTYLNLSAMYVDIHKKGDFSFCDVTNGVTRTAET